MNDISWIERITFGKYIVVNELNLFSIFTFQTVSDFAFVENVVPPVLSIHIGDNFSYDVTQFDSNFKILV